jgi:acyl CoA:acetate/3-ketoacid CoA transferase beta subunit
MMSVMPYTPIEMMIIAAAREIRDGETVFMGTYWPIPSVMLAKKTHAPHITIMVEGGLGIEAGRGRQTNSSPYGGRVEGVTVRSRSPGDVSSGREDKIVVGKRFFYVEYK